jgi:hypothetical protein
MNTSGTANVWAEIRSGCLRDASQMPYCSVNLLGEMYFSIMNKVRSGRKIIKSLCVS